MKHLSWILIAVCALLTALANLLLRAGLLKSGGLSFRQGEWLAGWAGTLLQPAFLTGLFLYGLAALIWFYALSVTEVSTGYPVLVGLTFVLVTVGAFGVFQESMNLFKVVGIVAILAGIACMARGA